MGNRWQWRDGGSLLVGLCLSLGGVCLLLLLLRFHDQVADDAFISARYARNLVEGHGLVFNAGERVEGYTNFLWTLLLAPGLWIGIDVETWWQVLGWGSLAALLWVVDRMVRDAEGPDRDARAVAAWLLAACPALAYWSSAGLETTLFAALWLASRARIRAAWAGGSAWAAGSLLVALGLTRADGALPVAAGLGVWWLRAGHRKDALRATVLVAAGAAAYGAWKLAYYGSLVPNTFHAKVTRTDVSSGLEYVGRWLVQHPWWLVAPAALAVPFFRNRGLRSAFRMPATDGGWIGALLAADVAVWVTYVIGIGGDAYPYGRFLLPLVAIGAVTAGRATANIEGRRGRDRLGYVLVALGLASFAQAYTGTAARQALLATRIARIGEDVGSFLQRRLPEDAPVAVNTGGAIGYRCRRPIVDMQGLTDPVIARGSVAPPGSRWDRFAHRRADGAYVLKRRPAVVLFGRSAGARRPVLWSDVAPLHQPGFRRAWHPVAGPLTAVQAKGRDDATTDTESVAALLRLPWEPPHLHPSYGLLDEVVPSGVVDLLIVRALSVPIVFWVRDDVDLAREPAGPDTVESTAPSGKSTISRGEAP